MNSIFDYQSPSLSSEKVRRQLDIFKKGVPPVSLVRAATPGDGIEVPNDREAESLRSSYKRLSKEADIAVFVPASGAASRMFKSLYEYLETDERNADVDRFVENVTRFAFADYLKEHLSQKGIKKELRDVDAKVLINALLNNDGLNYGNLPKALIDFHDYGEFTRKAVEEHLAEAAKYARNRDGFCRIHFTISPAHEHRFRTHLSAKVPRYEDKYKVRFKFEYSSQDPSTDTIAVDKNFQPLKLPSGEYFTRPGGHGALLDNLQRINADIAFIKNIDNVAVESKSTPGIEAKELLGGRLSGIRKRIFAYIKALDNEPSTAKLAEIKAYLKEDLKINAAENADAGQLKILLNRPVRVCGMVKNTRKPGGGPFWVKGKRGESLQIVETSEIDTGNDEQKNILENSTHFNPVDIVCSLTDYKGEQFDLGRFRDDDRVFISEKSIGGKSVLALEHPGLWNGGMSDWITIFMEVPAESFNPVKTVLDLLGDHHIDGRK